MWLLCLDCLFSSGYHSGIHCAPHACVVDFSRKQPPGREEEVLFYTFSTVMVSNDVPEDGVASEEETTISGDAVQEVVGSVEETIVIDDEGTNRDAAQAVVASVEESISKFLLMHSMRDPNRALCRKLLLCARVHCHFR